jgi:hypothetical protein
LKHIAGFLLVFTLLFSTNLKAQGLIGHMLAQREAQREREKPAENRNDGVQRSFNCIGLPYQKGVGCTMYVGSRKQLNFTRAYIIRRGVTSDLNSLTTMNNGLVHAITIAPIEYGDAAAIEWEGGRYSIWLGGSLSLASWSNYAARLMVQADRMMQEAGILNIDPALGTFPVVPVPITPAPTVPVGGYSDPTVPQGIAPNPVAPGMPMTFGLPTPSCAIIQQEIQMTMEAIHSSQNAKAGMEDTGSIWTSGMAGVVSQNQQRLQELQEQSTHCSN